METLKNTEFDLDVSPQSVLLAFISWGKVS
jgi:hypothetical protein